MKDKLLKLIATKEARQKEIKELIKNSSNIEEVRTLGTEKETLDSEIVELRNMVNDMEKSPQLNPLGTYSQREIENQDLETRLAFARYVVNGEKRADANTVLTDVTSVVPKNLVNEIYSTVENYGMILPLVNHTSYAVGQTIPTDGVKPTASWVAEGGSSDRQKKTTGTITFNAFKVRCEISFSQEVSVQTLPTFEALFVKQCGEAIAKAVEAKIVSANDGTTAPTGILYTTGTDAKVEIAKLATGHFDYKALCDAEALLPQQYENGAKWFMSKKTFMNIYSLIDSNGQPIGRINYGIAGKPERFLLGREVICNPYVDDYTEITAVADKTVAFLFNMNDYTLNKSYDLGIQKKQDWETEDHLVKAVASFDGKVIDRNSLVKVVKKYN